MKVAAGRRIAYRVLGIVRERDAFTPNVLDRLLTEADLQRPDAAHATRLVYGTLQYSGSLDVVIDRFAHRPGEVEPAVRDVLRVATYEILFGEGAQHAAVHQAVEAVRAIRPAAANMANAILRRVVGEKDAFPWADADTDLHALALETGHPEWLVEMWIAELGWQATRTVLDADNHPAPLYLRHNPFLGDEGSLMAILEVDGARPSACELPGCVWASTPAAAVNGRAVAEGFAMITDAAAQFATIAAAPKAGSVVVEIGAGRGTKTAELQALAVEAGSPARLYSVDSQPHKVRIAEDRVAMLGVPSVRAIVGDGRDLLGLAQLPGPSEVDLVFVDAPCSGLGTLRRHPMKRWRVSRDDIARLAVLQGELLAGAAPLVKTGGAIVYATCTVSRSENQDVVAKFLDSELGSCFYTADLEQYVPEAWREWITAEGWFQSLPSRSGPDGHFVARLERR